MTSQTILPMHCGFCCKIAISQAPTEEGNISNQKSIYPNIQIKSKYLLNILDDEKINWNVKPKSNLLCRRKTINLWEKGSSASPSSPSISLLLVLERSLPPLLLTFWFWLLLLLLLLIIHFVNVGVLEYIAEQEC